METTTNENTNYNMSNMNRQIEEAGEYLTTMGTKLMKYGILSIIGILVISLVFLMIIKIQTIKGDQIGVKETWSEGVLPETLPARTYILFPAFTQKIFIYPLSQQLYVMNDENEPIANGRDKDSYLVQSQDQQNMRVSMALQWRLNPSKIIDLHKTVGTNIEEVILRPELQKIVKDEATTRTALEAYSGEGLVKLQKAILEKLKDPNGELGKRGIVADIFVIQKIDLDHNYIKEITERQVAIQARLKNLEQTKAAQAAAEKAKAEAQANYEKTVVEANRDKMVGILSAEQKAQQMVLNAEAQKKQTVLSAEAEKDSGELRAKAIIAIGNAEAEAIKMKMLAYSGSGAENFVKMEVAKSLSDAYKNISGYLPSDMNIMLLSDKYNGAVNLLAAPAKK